ncbi:concanavalin A-like lectin/glucanase domain-containing protein [Polychytrium aggregatum]|uniref:concanavalin A-like lectin/glucanase domain-containing protein n=1 Tax=Polychytrium aggregatum TaxID=110093 RepID=UPI0022FF1E0C|nr:concanavalin A-like lectin/glucanase domain-containing protein [Polychytrium aggregatum]KAI9203201.1 concanavalin A-like lectin/glucanase domain-containing protein [Polychytrium aggregatum]
MVGFTSSHLLSAGFALSALVSLGSAQFSPLKCFGDVNNTARCEYSGDNCYFFDDFNTLSAAPWSSYTGDMSANFVIESGSPYVKDGILYMPLLESFPNAHRGNASIMSTTGFLNYGSFEARLATVGHSGVITTLISISNVQDEIDFEFVPKQPSAYNEVQANWYHRGEATYDVNFNSGQTNNNTFDNFHVYNLTWTPDVIEWRVDGQLFNSLNRLQMGNNSFRFPNTPSRISFGIWNAQDNKWAGNGTIDYATLPGELHARFDYIRVVGLGCNSTTPRTLPATTATAAATSSASNGVSPTGVPNKTASASWIVSPNLILAAAFAVLLAAQF